MATWVDPFFDACVPAALAAIRSVSLSVLAAPATRTAELWQNETWRCTTCLSFLQTCIREVSFCKCSEKSWIAST